MARTRRRRAQATEPWWRSGQVLAAAIAAVATVLAAAIGYAAVTRDGGPGPGPERVSETVTSAPEAVFVRSASYAPQDGGAVLIRVRGGTTRELRAHESVYALARPSGAPGPWWPSPGVRPDEGGNWAAEVEAAPQLGQEVEVVAVALSALGDVDPGAEPVAPPEPLSQEEILAHLRRDGPQARPVTELSPTFELPAAPPPG